MSGSQSRWTSWHGSCGNKEKERKKMEITSAVVYKPQLQTALEKKTADVFCKNLKKFEKIKNAGNDKIFSFI